MKHSRLLVGIVIVVALAAVAALVGGRMANAQDPLKMGTVLARAVLAGAEGREATLVLRELPPGGTSGWHTQSGNEIVYVMEGSVVLEVRDKPAVTVAAGETFQTMAGEVHNVKNASDTVPGKALAFYVAAAGTALEDLSLPAE